MAQIYLSLGSNIDRRRHIQAGLDWLDKHYAPLLISSVYESEAIGFKGDPFYNLVVGFSASIPLETLALKLRNLEYKHGRQPNSSKFSSRTLDIDILLYDDWQGCFSGIELPRAEVLDNAFVLLPLQEIAPQAQHPREKQAFAELWQNYPKAQSIHPVSFIWHNQELTRTYR